MKSQRPRFNKSLDTDEGLFGIWSIIPNFIAIVILLAGYLYILNKDLFPEWLTYIYWTVNVIVSYNIIAASARSFVMPILTILGGGACLIGYTQHQIDILSIAQIWQLLILGMVGLIIAAVLKL